MGPRPEDWEPSPQHFAKGRELGFDRDELEAMSEAFTNHHDAKGSVFASWDAAFSTWIRNQHRFDGEKGIERTPLGPEPPRRPPPQLELGPAGPPLTPEKLAETKRKIAALGGARG